MSLEFINKPGRILTSENGKGNIKKSIILIVTLGLLLFFPAGARPQEETETATAANYYPELKVHKVAIPFNPPSKVETLYSWSLREVDVRDVMLTFAKGSKMNIVVEPDVSGKVTVDLTKVRFEQALDYILTPLGLKYSREGNFILVYKPRLETRLFKLDYVNTQRIGEGSLTASAGGGQDSSSLSIANSTRVDFWGAVVDALSTIVFGADGSAAKMAKSGAFSKEDEDGRKLVINPQAGIVMVSALEETLQEVEEFIKAVQTASQRQVLIQAKIVEVTLSDDFEMGINWQNVSHFSLGGLLGDNGMLSLGTVGAFNPALVPVPQAETFQMGIYNEKLQVLLDALATQGNLNVLSSPQIVTLNNQTAMIKVTREDVYFEVTTSIDDDTNARTETIKSTPIDVGIVLEVTPQISKEGVITLNIHPSVSEVVDVATSKLGDTRPIVDRRETNTVVKVNDGQTIVLAGLIKDKKSETLKMVPCLGEIPIIGALFRHTVQSKEKVELVIMLTPLILTKDRIDIVSRYKNGRLKKMQKNLHLGVPPHSEGLQGELE